MSVEILLSESSAIGRQTDWVKCYLYQEDKNENLIPSYKRDETGYNNTATNEPVHEISNNVVCATSKTSDQPAHTRSLIRAFASRLSIL